MTGEITFFDPIVMWPVRHRQFFEQTLFLIPLFPFIGFLLNGLYGRKLDRKLSGVIAVSAAFAAFVWALLCMMALEPLRGTATPDVRNALHAVYGDWLGVPGLNIPFGLYYDEITLIMILVVTGVGTLIHFYSMGYMEHDEGLPRFFAYLNLFLFSMCVLVLADNLVLMFVGWEGVGLCSYLLIGFWYEVPANAAAGMKAFVVNRIGDLGFVLGIFTLIVAFGTASYVAPPLNGKTHQTVTSAGYVKLPAQPGLLDYGDAMRMISSTGKAQTTHLTVGGKTPTPVSNWDLSRIAAPDMLKGLTITVVLGLACILLLLGAAGKSAQIPLYVWLPDAMAGPTPVSALIHAATMVTAGVYMICRLHGLYSAAPPFILMTVAAVGCGTALLAALIGLTQLDIKRVLAYSTISQLGYMFLALGVGAYSLALFHLMTHAFFKALLFLGAGVVIHALSGEQDMRFMGGLRNKLPKTFATMLIGALALAGFPLLAGWWSKDAILFSTLVRYEEQHNAFYLVLYVAAVLTALCTAFYTFRLIFLTFFGQERVKPEVKEHVHEPSGSMIFPLLVLAGLSLVGGWMWNHVFYEGIAWHAQETPAVAKSTAGASAAIAVSALPPLGIRNLVDLSPHAHDHAHHLNLIVTTLIVLAGIALAWFIYARKRHVPDPTSRNPLYRMSLQMFGIDQFYTRWIVGGFVVLSEIFHWAVETLFIDLIATGSGYAVSFFGNRLRRIQTGVLNSYALAILLGAVAALFFILKQRW